MDQIRREINDCFPPAVSKCDFNVTANDVINFIPKLNNGKSDGNGGLSTDQFVYVSFIFSSSWYCAR